MGWRLWGGSGPGMAWKSWGRGSSRRQRRDRQLLRGGVQVTSSTIISSSQLAISTPLLRPNQLLKAKASRCLSQHGGKQGPQEGMLLPLRHRPALGVRVVQRARAGPCLPVWASSQRGRAHRLLGQAQPLPQQAMPTLISMLNQGHQCRQGLKQQGRSRLWGLCRYRSHWSCSTRNSSSRESSRQRSSGSKRLCRLTPQAQCSHKSRNRPGHRKTAQARGMRGCLRALTQQRRRQRCRCKRGQAERRLVQKRPQQQQQQQ